MPRIRTIKPQFWLDENLGTLSRDARLLYIGLWNLSDDTGVFQWRPLQIKAQIFPYDTDVNGQIIEEWLDLLVGIKDIERIEFDGKTFGRISSFLEHQDIKNPSKWTFLNGKEKIALPQPYPSPTPALPVGKKEKKRVIGKKEKGNSRPLKQKFGEFLNVFLTTEEYEKLIKKFGVENTNDRIERLGAYLKSIGKPQKYDDHYATILSWARRDEKEGKGGKGNLPTKYQTPEEHLKSYRAKSGAD